MKYLLAILLLFLPIAAQTKADLDRDFAPVRENVYSISPSIAFEVKYSSEGKVSSYRVFPLEPLKGKTILSEKEIRDAILKLVGDRVCRSRLSGSRVKIECPSGKDCFGVREKWKTMTTLMAWQNKKWLYAEIELIDTPAAPPPGKMKLLPGYEHTEGCGIDTRAGTIKKIGGIEISYDIGQMAGNFASRHEIIDNALWVRRESIRDDTVLIVLTNDNRIYATYHKASANFYAHVGSQSNIDDFINMVLTF